MVHQESNKHQETPERPLLKERPGTTYQYESFFNPRTQYTYQVFIDGKWHEYDKETKQPTGKVF